MVLALTVCGIVVALVVLGLFVFGLRRRLIQRSGGTFDCSLRWDVPEKPDASGKGWSYGVARYNGDRIEWYRVFSYAYRPRSAGAGLDRGGGPTAPGGRGGTGAAVRRGDPRLCPSGTRLELAMSEDALTGFLAWLEAAPPGQRVNVA